jgi:hypothetical protein
MHREVHKLVTKRYVRETAVEMAGAIVQGACWTVGALLVIRLARR